jgi:glycosyltransferase involved in cell wall biosynthesis
MKVSIICGAGMLSGKEMMALELGRGLRKAGHEISYVTSLWGDGKFLSRLNELGFTKACMRIGFISATLTLECLRMTADQLLRMPGLWLDYARFLKRETPDQIIHTNWHHLLVLWPFLNTRRDWFWLHEMIPDKPQYRRVFGTLSRRLRGFVPVSQAVKESLIRIGIPEDKIHVIHNGLSDPAPAGGVPPRHWSGVRFGIAGQIGSWKGHQDLLEAFSLIASRHLISELHVFGDGSLDYVTQLKHRAEVLGLGNRLFWHGFVADRKDIYGELDICVVPSRTPDPLPTVAIEAAFFGLPVIASRSGGLPEIVQDSITGFLAEPSHPAELAARLDELLGDAEMRRRMGAAAEQHARTHFSQERFVTEFLGLLSK